MRCKSREGDGRFPKSSLDGGLPPMSWDKNGELDAKANWSLVQKLWGPHADVIAEMQKSNCSQARARRRYEGGS
jgi:hypothetical protein